MRAASLFQRCVLSAALLTGLPASTLAQEASPQAEAPPKLRITLLTPGCMREVQAAVAVLRQAPDRAVPEPLPRAPAEVAQALRERAQHWGLLDMGSLLSPPSVYELLQLPAAEGAPAEACPLHQLYIAFRQGGFAPQTPVFYGPLRSRV